MTVVKLTVHKNNRLQRKKKDLRQAAVRDVKTCVRPQNIVGYCTVAWCEDGTANMAWNIPAESPVRIHDVPKFMKRLIKKKIIRMGL